MRPNLASVPILFLKAFKGQHGYALYGHPLRWHKVTPDKPAPKGAPTAAHPLAAGEHAPKQHLAEHEWAQLKLPESNTNSGTFNGQLDKLKQMSEAGHVTGILAAGYGTNTYGKKLASVANHLLGLHGSEHKVTPGQKAGEHPAVQQPPAPKPEPQPEPEKPAEPTPAEKAVAAVDWASLILPESNSNAATVNKKVAALKAAAEKGDAAAVAAIPTGKNTYNLKIEAAKQKVLAALGAGGSPAPVQEAPPAQPPKVTSVTASAPKPAMPELSLHGKVAAAGNSNKVATLLHDHVTKNGKTPEAFDEAYSAAFDHGYHDHAANIAKWKGKTHPSTSLAGVPAKDYISQVSAKVAGKPAAEQAAAVKDAAEDWLAANPGAWDELSEALRANQASDVAAGMDLPAPAEDEPPTPAAPTGVEAVQIPDFGGDLWDKRYAMMAAHIKQQVLEKGKAGFGGLVTVHKTGWKAGGFTLKVPNPDIPSQVFKAYVGPISTVERAKKMYAFMAQLQEAMAQAKTPKKPKPPKVSKVVQSGPKEGDTKQGVGGLLVFKNGHWVLANQDGQAAPTHQAAPPEPIDGWVKSGSQGGYNDGAYYTDPNGQQWYCKFSSNSDVPKAEMLALKLYEAAGENVPEMKLVTRGGKIGTASKIVPGLKQDKELLKSGKAHAIFSGFAADAWLANWDTVGNNPAPGKGWDNIQFTPDGKAYRIDAGGALHFKGAGGKKSAQQWGDHVVELKTMLDPSINQNTAKAFGQMTPADIKASVAKVLAIPDQTITDLVNAYAPGTDAEKKALADKLIARKQSIAAQHPDVAAKVASRIRPQPKQIDPNDTSWVKLKPGEKIVESGAKFGVAFVKIEIPAKGFHADGIPTPFVYDKSSSKFVNEANTADIKAIYDLALSTQDPDAVKNITFDAVDKATGAKSGQKLTIDQHPSKAWVKEYLTQVVAELEAQLKPTYRIEHRGSFAGSFSAAAAEIAARVKTLGYNKFKSWASKAADYLVLDKAAGSGVPVPEAGQFKNVEPSDAEMVAFKKASDANFNKLTDAEKAACKSYTGSAYYKWNEALRTGDTDSSYFKAAQTMVNAFEKAAAELPEGIILHRGIGVGGETYDSIVGAVIQDGSFQSCSYGKKAAFSSMPSQLRLHVTKGVKGIMATTFSNYGSGEREIILHPNCRYVVMKVAKGHPNQVDVLVLPHEGTK